MRTFWSFNEKRASWDTVQRLAPGAHYYNPPMMLTWSFKRREHEALLLAGSGDHLSCYREGDLLVVFSACPQGRYLGAQVFGIETGEELGDVFINDYELEGYGLPRNAADEFTDLYLAKRLLSFVNFD